MGGQWSLSIAQIVRACRFLLYNGDTDYLKGSDFSKATFVIFLYQKMSIQRFQNV